jgi:hypothetical protein
MYSQTWWSWKPWLTSCCQRSLCLLRSTTLTTRAPVLTCGWSLWPASAATTRTSASSSSRTRLSSQRRAFAASQPSELLQARRQCRPPMQAATGPPQRCTLYVFFFFAYSLNTLIMPPIKSRTRNESAITEIMFALDTPLLCCVAA